MNLYFIKDEDEETVGVFFTNQRNPAAAIQAAGENDVVMPGIAYMAVIPDDPALESLDGEILLT